MANIQYVGIHTSVHCTVHVKFQELLAKNWKRASVSDAHRGGCLIQGLGLHAVVDHEVNSCLWIDVRVF